jgi:proteasome lid subunit RPN8/RPN11
LIFTNKEYGLELSITENLIDEIRNISMNQYPNEFGGFLIGEYSNDFKKAVIEKIILPKKYKGSPTEFYRSTAKIETVFTDIFQNESLYFLGEWHSHPNGTSMFSRTDLKAMAETAVCDTVKIKNPILLILSFNERKVNDYTFYVYENNDLKRYE